MRPNTLFPTTWDRTEAEGWLLKEMADQAGITTDEIEKFRFLKDWEGKEFTELFCTPVEKGVARILKIDHKKNVFIRDWGHGARPDVWKLIKKGE